MSGKKKLARKSVVLVSSRRGQGRRRARSGIKRQAIRQLILNGAIVIFAVLVIEVLVTMSLPHGSAIVRRDPVVAGGKSLTSETCDIGSCVHHVIHDDYSQRSAQ